MQREPPQQSNGSSMPRPCIHGPPIRPVSSATTTAFVMGLQRTWVNQERRQALVTSQLHGSGLHPLCLGAAAPCRANGFEAASLAQSLATPLPQPPDAPPSRFARITPNSAKQLHTNRLQAIHHELLSIVERLETGRRTGLTTPRSVSAEGSESVHCGAMLAASYLLEYAHGLWHHLYWHQRYHSGTRRRRDALSGWMG